LHAGWGDGMAGGAFVSLAIDRQSRTPFFIQIYKQLRLAIAAGRIDSATRLPSTRRFAKELGVSRTTIVVAYDQLIADGYAEGRRGSAVFACDVKRISAPALAQRPGEVTPARRVIEQGAVRTFCPDTPDMQLFPYKPWSRALARTVKDHATGLVTDSPLFGDMYLREEIARHLYERRGMQVSPEQIIITAGSGDALNCILRAVTKKGDAVAMEDPGSVLLHRYARTLGLIPEWLGGADAGAELPGIDTPPPKLTVISPSYRFPVGGVMPLDRRLYFLQRAEQTQSWQTQSWIVEDDSNCEFQFEGTPLPPLAALSRSHRVIYVGSFSRVLSHALRLGYVIVPPLLIDCFAESISAFDQRASVIQQRPLSVMMNDGSFDQCLRNMRKVYASRRRNFIDQLADAVGTLIAVEGHEAGLEIALRFTSGVGVSDVMVAAEANSRGLFCRALSSYCSGPDKMSGLVLGCCGSDQDHLGSKFRILRDIIAARLVQ
jgi:GntR family transcriptional regulator/MocR family aminotransferase